MFQRRSSSAVKYQKLNNEVMASSEGGRNNDNLNMFRNNFSCKNVDTKVVDAKTLSSSWFRPRITRTQAESLLKQSTVGCFLIRSSSSPGKSYALSVRVAGRQVQHHLLLVTGKQQQVRLHGSSKLFPSVFSLVTHLSIMKENLPCNLHLNYYDSESSTETEDDENEDIIDIDTEPNMEEILTQLKKFLQG